MEIWHFKHYFAAQSVTGKGAEDFYIICIIKQKKTDGFPAVDALIVEGQNSPGIFIDKKEKI